VTKWLSNGGFSVESGYLVYAEMELEDTLLDEWGASEE
jgi:hypothetical protein